MSMSFVLFLIGLATGSFLNVCIDRLPKRQSLVEPASRCEACEHRLAALDLIPLLSCLLLRGRCRYCGAPIPYRVPLVELATGLLFVLLWHHYGGSLQLVLALVFVCLFIIIFFIDLEHRLILNRVVYPAICIAVVIAISTQYGDILKPLLGGVAGAGLLSLVALVLPSGMGWGDVKFGAFIGLVAGFPEVLVGLLIAFILGGIVSGGLLLMKRKGRKDYIPFGPFLAVGGLVTMLYGVEILTWYQGRW